MQVCALDPRCQQPIVCNAESLVTAILCGTPIGSNPKKNFATTGSWKLCFCSISFQFLQDPTSIGAEACPIIFVRALSALASLSRSPVSCSCRNPSVCSFRSSHLIHCRLHLRLGSHSDARFIGDCVAVKRGNLIAAN